MNVDYIIYNPNGNITAIVLDDKYSKQEKKKINDEIMKKEKEVEQVGFISNTEFKLTMAGDEFCGNATRCAISYYSKNKKEDIKIKVSGTTRILNGGIEEDNNVWTEIPVEQEFDKVDDKTYIVRMDGIKHILVKNEEPRKEQAINLINKYKDDNKAIGCIFINEKEEGIKIDPFIWVKDIDILFYENSCGSGTACAGMLYLNEKRSYINVLQPSGDTIKVFADNKNKIYILGKVNTDGVIRNIEI